MQTIKDKIDQYVNDLYDDIHDDAKWKYKDNLRAAFRDVVEQVVEEMTGEEKEPTSDKVKITRYRGYSQGRNTRIAEEKATGENIIKSLE